MAKQVSQESFHIKKNDEVVVISGSHRGSRGKVLQILTSNNRVLIEGVNLIKKAVRKSQQNPQGGLVEREGTIHVSNVMRAEDYAKSRAAKK
jgi:large subunit ribosomal protein L24